MGNYLANVPFMYFLVFSIKFYSIGQILLFRFIQLFCVSISNIYIHVYI